MAAVNIRYEVILSIINMQVIDLFFETLLV